MDILNWVYLIKNKFTRTTVENPATDLIVLGADVSYQKRGDKYQNYVMTVEDFLAPAARPYKVYTALLTQSGGDDPQNWSSGSGPLILGVTYQIEVNDGGTADFTNVGAPNNNVGTYFVATGTTPNSWGIGDNGELSANGGAPVVTVLENTIGNVWFTYSSVGEYTVESKSLFTDKKTFQFINNDYTSGDDGQLIISNGGSDTTISLLSRDGSQLPIDGSFYLTPIEIRVYN